jgi:hypothetical protein
MDSSLLLLLLLDCLTFYFVCYLFFVFLRTRANFVIGPWTNKFAHI